MICSNNDGDYPLSKFDLDGGGNGSSQSHGKFGRRRSIRHPASAGSGGRAPALKLAVRAMAQMRAMSRRTPQSNPSTFCGRPRPNDAGITPIWTAPGGTAPRIHIHERLEKVRADTMSESPVGVAHGAALRHLCARCGMDACPPSTGAGGVVQG